MRRVLFLTIVLSAILASSCAELQQISEEISNSVILTEEQIGDGLKEALTKGINEEVTKLTQEDGFYSNLRSKLNCLANWRRLKIYSKKWAWNH